MGYKKVPIVTEVAEFSVRGGIVDVYGFGMAAPARLEWWGDDLESIRSFDLTTQRSGDAIDELTILPIRSAKSARGNSIIWLTILNSPTSPVLILRAAFIVLTPSRLPSVSALRGADTSL